MTELTIFNGAEPVGTLTEERDGLYRVFHCKIEKKTERPLRVYVLSTLSAEYLGIPDADGKLTAHIPARHFRAEPDGALASELPRGQWKPWRGVLDGVAVDFCLLRQEDDGYTVAFPEEEAIKFPQWLDDMTQITAFGKQWASVAMDNDGHLPPKETEYGGTENETNPINPADRSVPDDDAAAGGFRENGWEADRADL